MDGQEKHSQTIDFGGVRVQLQVDGDGIGSATYSGLLGPSNFLALSVLVMRAGAAHGARGLMYCLGQAATCFSPESLAGAYDELAPQLKALPVAFVTNDGQADLHRLVVQRAAAHGLLRRQFAHEAEARDWLLRTSRTIDHNLSWWQQRQRRPARSGPGAESEG